MNIIFYKLQDKINDVNKTLTLTATATYIPLTITGKLRASTSKIAPVIDFAQDITYFNNYNYAYIADFGRYYFVDNVVSVRENVTSISFRVDVLTSFLTQSNISSISGYVVRCNNPLYYSTKLPDNLIQFKLKPTIIETTPDRLTINDIDTIFRVSPIVTSSGGTTTVTTPKNISVTTMAEAPSTIISYTVTIPTDLRSFYNSYTNFEYLYPDTLRASSGELVHICNNTGLGGIVDLCISNDTIKSYVKNIVAFPFELDSSGTGGTTFYYGTHHETVSGVVIATTKSYTQFMCVDDFYVNLPTDIDKYTYDFMVSNNYLIIEYYVPYYGWVKLDPASVTGHRLKLYYLADIRTGNALVNLLDVTDHKIVFTTNCQVGVKISLDSTNAFEVARKDEANSISYVLSLLASIGASAVGAVSGNVPLAVGGATGMITSSGSFINKELTNIEYAKANLGGDVTSLMSIQKTKIRYTLKEPVLPKNDLAHFRTNFGYPTHKELTFSELKNQMSTTQYVQITDLHIADLTSYIADITIPEAEELETLCSRGIYV